MRSFFREVLWTIMAWSIALIAVPLIILVGLLESIFGHKHEHIHPPFLNGDPNAGED